ncbi:MAG: hypothetical protein AAGA70_12445 [Pseudomonadota bacterium]
MAIMICAAIIWITLTLGFLHEMVNVRGLSEVLEPAGFLAVIAFATLSVLGLVLAKKSWPEKRPTQRGFEARPMGKLAADIE